MSDDINCVVLIPVPIIPAMVVDGTTVPEVDPARGEVAWAAGEYAIKDWVVHAGKVYECVKPTTDKPNAVPGTAAAESYWLFKDASNRMSAFDDELDTKTYATGSLTLVLQPGFFTGLALWGVEGDHLLIRILDAPGGEEVERWEGDLYEQALGLYELLFMPLRQRTQMYLRNLPLYANPEIHITITASGDAQVAVALVSVGHWDTLLGTDVWGGIEYGGATAAVKSYSYLQQLEGGRTKRVRRGSSTNVSCNVAIAADQANHAVNLLHQVQGKPVAFIASGMARYDYLSGFGDISGQVTPETPVTASAAIKIEGVVQ